MNQQPLLLTAVSALAFFSASTSFASYHPTVPNLEGPSETLVKLARVANPVSDIELKSQLTLNNHHFKTPSHFEVDVEGFLVHGDTFNTSLHVANATNASTAVYSAADPFSLSKNSAAGGAASLRYVFGNDWDVSASFGYWSRSDTPSNSPKTYYSHSQVAADSASESAYTTSITSTDGNSSDPWTATIGSGGNDDGVFAILSSTETLAETAKFTYASGNIDAGRFFQLGRHWSLHPYAGLAYRHIGYKDTVTFTTTGQYSGSNTVATDFFGPSSFGNTAQLTTFGASTVYEWRGGGALVAVASGTVDTVTLVEPTTSTTDYYNIYSNEEYVVSGNTNYIGDHLPSYTSKFNGIGPRIGMDVHYSFWNYFSLGIGAEFSMPYASLKTTGTTSLLSTEDLQSSGQGIHDTTDSDAILGGRNLKLVSSDAFSYSNTKVIPETQLRVGVTFTNTAITADHLNYRIEVGYRYTEDWNALKNVDFKKSSGSTSSQARDAYTSLSSAYKSMSSYGPYLKVGVGFTT